MVLTIRLYLQTKIEFLHNFKKISFYFWTFLNDTNVPRLPLVYDFELSLDEHRKPLVLLDLLCEENSVFSELYSELRFKLGFQVIFGRMR